MFTLIVVYNLSAIEAFATSPSFPLQVINDSRKDWIDWTNKHPFEKDGSIDITRVDYFSNGKTLNATMWLACEPKESSYEDSLSLCNQNNIQISVENLHSKNVTLKEYTNATINKLDQSLYQPIQIESDEDTILAGNPSHKIVYTATSGDLKTLQIWTVKDGKAYTITYTATPANYANYFKSIIQNMINSFEIGNIQSTNRKANYSSYQNNTYGIKILFPSNWQHQNGGFNYGNTTKIVTFFPRTLDWVTYGMYIDADNNNKTGMLGGIDYTFNFFKADNDKSWSKQIEQWATPTDFRIIDRIDNYRDLFGRFGGVVNLSVDLDTIGSPDNYKVIFFAIKGNATNVYERVGDYTNWVLIPPPKLAISILPNPSEIRQEENKRVELQLKSNTGFLSQTHIFIKRPAEMDFKYSSDTIQIPPLGIVTIPLNIKVFGNAEVGPQTVPISITSSFPTELYQNNTSYGAFHLGNLRFKIPSVQSNIVNETSDLTVDVQKGLDAGERIAAFWKDFGGPISLVGGGFAGGFSGWVFGRFQHKSKNNKDEKLDRRSN